MLLWEGVHREDRKADLDDLGCEAQIPVTINLIMTADVTDDHPIFHRQIFVDGKKMKVARFPDMGEEETLLTTDKENYLPTEILMPPAPGQSILKFSAVKDFPTDAFVGGIYSGMHGRNSFTASTGLIKEVNDNILEQCLIEDIGWLGRRTAGVQAWGQRNHVLRNVIRKVGNSGIDGGQRGFGVGRFGRETDIRFNLVMDIGYLASHDIGMYYVNTQGFREPLKQVIAYNTMLGFKGHLSVNNTPCPAIYTDNGTQGVIAHDNVSDLRCLRRGGVSVVYRNNSAEQNPLAPIATEEGIKKLLNDDASCPPLDAGAFVDQEIPGLRVGRAGSRRSEFFALDDRKDYSVDELKEVFPPLDRARWEREKREQAKRREEGEKKRLERQRVKERE